MYASEPPHGASTALITTRAVSAPRSYSCSMKAMIRVWAPRVAAAMAASVPGSDVMEALNLPEVGLADADSQTVDDAGGRHGGELALDRVGKHHQVAHLARPVADVVGEQRLRLEAQRAEHADQRLLVGDDLDDELRQRHL